MRHLTALAAAAALAGCGTVPTLPNFQDRTGRNGALLLRVTSENYLPADFSAGQFNLRVYAVKGGTRKLAWVHPLDAMPASPRIDELILLELPPGRYALDLLVGYQRKEFHLLDLPEPAGSFADAAVRPGEVTALGQLALHVHITETAEAKDESALFSTQGTALNWNDWPKARKQALSDAADDPRAPSTGWLPAIQAALAAAQSPPSPH